MKMTFCTRHAKKTHFSKGQLHNDDILLQLPEFISVLLCYLNLSIPMRLKKNSLNLYKKTTKSRILVVVVKWRHRAIVQLTNVLHLASLWKWDFFWNSQMAFFFRKSLPEEWPRHVLRVREIEHPTQTLIFAKTAGLHNLVEVIFFCQWGSQGNSPLCLFINYFHGTE